MGVARAVLGPMTPSLKIEKKISLKQKQIWVQYRYAYSESCMATETPESPIINPGYANAPTFVSGLGVPLCLSLWSEGK